ncbi:uncharacterized protein [Rutidosis leptorrhynchoides]|uniref:uncharacterized protein isoform X2 n=1 Tax=Rutidosis leptorrhynchoides TaxID=125765 RepID=UPI003A9952C3
MDLFQNAKIVRLKSYHKKYLHAGSDKESVYQHRKGESKNTRWMVELVSQHSPLVRLKSCFNKYLTTSGQPFLLGATGYKVTQTAPQPLDSSVEWEPKWEGNMLIFKTKQGQYLRANTGLPPWRNSVTYDIPLRTSSWEWILWDVEILVQTGPGLHPSLSHLSDFSFTSTHSPSSSSSSDEDPVEAPEPQDVEESSSFGLQKLMGTLKYQEVLKAFKLQAGTWRIDFELLKAIFRMPNIQVTRISNEDIDPNLSTGILLDEGKVWLSINSNGKTEEMISALNFKHPSESQQYDFQSSPSSRFSKVARIIFDEKCLITKLLITTQFLSSDITYGAYIVFRPYVWQDQYQNKAWSLRYKVNNISQSYKSYNKGVEKNQWMTIQLFQTVVAKRNTYFEVTLESFRCSGTDVKDIMVDGIMFIPLSKYEDDDKNKTLEVESLSKTSNVQWDDVLPSDYKQFIKCSNKEMMKMKEEDVIYPTKEEAYSLLTKGVHIEIEDKANYWFSITKSNGKKSFVIQPEALYLERWLVNLRFYPSTESRLGRVLDIRPASDVYMEFFHNQVLLSKDTSYECYLIYKLPQGLVYPTPVTATMFDYKFFSLEERCQEKKVFLSIPQVPVIGPDGEMIRSATLVTNFKNVQVPKERNDGWLEVKVWGSDDICSKITKSTKQQSTTLSCLCGPCWFLKCLCLSNDDEGANGMRNSSTSSKANIGIELEFHDEDEVEKPNVILQGLELRPCL